LTEFVWYLIGAATSFGVLLVWFIRQWDVVISRREDRIAVLEERIIRQNNENAALRRQNDILRRLDRASKDVA
jgi:hypothetical protein